ncbi:hypothetical protein ABC977_05330 [Thioalkalicoccus limnaeus]|uniref:Uncharacterized protein n=1 Tax=Thioalkalicoccus limnaeus TaxID=120681 RepID=A0ABV4BHD6_9GAMM
MGPLPPFQVTVDSKGWLCVLDIRLALATQGPMLALRLAEELRVCLVPRLWSILDNTAHYQRCPADLLTDPFASSPGRAPDPRALAQWERVRLDLGLSAVKLYWAGDAMHESRLPKEVDAEVIERFERLGAALERRLLHVSPDMEPALPLLGGAMDATALAAAMARYRPLILTLAEPDQGVPALASLLATCGIESHEVGAVASQPLRRLLTPVLARSGVLELCWTGLDLTFVHLVAPRAFLPEIPGEPAPDLGADRLSDSADDLWQDATAFWYRLP